MGIRVVCPNGHRLHLKSQLAGRRGLCPDCGARFRIPTESSDTPQPFAEPPKRPANPTAAAIAQPTSGGVAPVASVGPAAQVETSSIPSAVPVASPVAPVDTLADAPADASVEPVQATLAQSGPSEVAQIPIAAVSIPPNIRDPFSAAPQAQWYVQPPSGGRYGPAQADVLKQWIAEGRVTEDCLVWRDGWPEWQSASTILSSGSDGASSSVSDAVAVLPDGGNSVAYRRRKNSKGVGIAMIVILGLACVALLGVLFLLISNGTISLAPPGPAE